MSDQHISPSLPDSRPAAFALNELIVATRALADALKNTARQLHGPSHLSVPARAVLLELRKSGPATVPELARRRQVSRQFMQVTVNALLEGGVLVSRTNPAHRRSKLVALSAEGTELIRQVMRREGALLQELAVELAPDDLRQATATLTRLQRLLAR